MLKSLALSLLLFTGINSFAQNDEYETVADTSADTIASAVSKATSELTKMFTTKINMDIDTLVFDKKMGNIYMSEKYQAMIFCLAIPQTLEQAEEHFNKETSSKKEYKLITKGKMMANGKEIIYQKGTVKKDGKKMNMNIYALKGDENTTIFITAGYLPKDENMILSLIEKAVKSAQLESIK